MSSIVRPEFGESLPTTVGPKWRALGGRWRALIIAAAVIVALALIYFLLLAGSPTRQVAVAAPVPFELEYDGDLLQQRLTVGRESLRLESPAGVTPKRTFTVKPLLLPAYKGSISGVLPLQAELLSRQMSAINSSFITIAEAPVLVNEQPGYEILFQISEAGKTVYGRRVMLFPPNSGARAGVDVTMTAPRSSQTLTAPVIAQQPPLREPFESLVVGN